MAHGNNSKTPLDTPKPFKAGKFSIVTKCPRPPEPIVGFKSDGLILNSFGLSFCRSFKAIKKQFEEIAAKFKIRSKVFKIVADQAANVKKAFVDTTQCDDVLTIATDLIRRQKNIDAIQEAERLRALQEQINREALESSIAEMNAPLTVLEPGRKRTAAE